MTRSDWTQIGYADTENQLSTKQVFSGESSLKSEPSKRTNLEALDVSLSDLPTDGRIVQQIYLITEDSGAMMGARIQDENNYYYCGLSQRNAFEWVFGKKVGGSHTRIDSLSLNKPGSLSVTLSNGSTDIAQKWSGPWRYSMWEDSSGDFRARLEEDTDGDGSFTQVGNDFVDSDPDLAGGGGIGVVFSTDGNTANDRPSYIDETEVWY